MRLKTLLAISPLLLAATPVFAQQMPPPGQMPVPGQGYFERADLNKDGSLTREEVRAGRIAQFTQLDANKDGFLTRDEMHTGMRQAPSADGMQGQRQGRHGGPNGRMKGGMHQMPDLFTADVNNDGAVTKAEFDAAQTRMRQERQAKMDAHGAEMFTRLDANKDGRITRDEAGAMRAQMAQHGRGGRPGSDRPNSMGQQVDTNNDGKVSRDEWAARPNPMFDAADANKDGRLTREEAASAVRTRRDGQGRGPGRPW